MSIEEDIAALVAVNTQIEESTSVLDRIGHGFDMAESVILDQISEIRRIQGQAQSTTLNSYAKKLRESLALIRLAQDKNVEAIVSLNKGRELGEEYIGRMRQ